MSASTARVVTPRAGRYGKQLASHLGRRSGGAWDEASGTGHILFGDAGARADLVAEVDALVIYLTPVPDDEVATLEDVVGRHLVRFGGGDLVVDWTRADGSAGTSQRPEPVGPLTVGVDIGGTKIAAGVVDARGVILARTKRATDPEDPAGIEASVVDCVRELSADHVIAGVGVAAAGFVSSDRTRVLFAPNIAWRDHPLAERIAAEVDVPVVIENDANAAGWAEYRFGAGAGHRDMVMLTLGTGLGGAIVTDGHLVRGAFGAGAELGHLKINQGGHRCGCGHEGCWEAYVSGTALQKAARAAVVAYPDLAASLLARAGGAKVKGVHVTQAARAGDPLAVELMTRFGWWLGVGMATMTATVDPGVFVLGGGISADADLFLPAARASYRNNLSGRGFRGEPGFVVASLGNEAGIVGAADSVRDILEEK